MNEQRIDDALAEWMRDDRPVASPWVLESIAEHARRHSNQAWWQRASRSLRTARAGSGDADRAVRRRWTAVPAFVAGVVALLLLAAVLAVVPGPSVPSLGSNGSLWRTTGVDGGDSYVMLHADGTAVTLTYPITRQVGIGIWRWTGPSSLTTLIAYPDADPKRHALPGFSTYRADWTLDDARQAARSTWVATLRPADGSAMADRQGSATYQRLALAPLPDDARYPVPSEQPWPASTGQADARPDAGSVVGITYSDGCTISEPSDYLALHGDGTALYVGASGGNGLGLWAWTGDKTRAISGWYGSWVVANHQIWVGQLIGTGQLLGRTGSSRVFDRTFTAGPRPVEVKDAPLPPADDSAWPELGSVWLQETDAGTAIIAFLADGTLVARDPRYGTGIGSWQPMGAGRTIGVIRFSTRLAQDHRVWLESTLLPDGDSMSIQFQHQDKSAGPDLDVGTATAVRLTFEP
jgi:hypothetical protein